MNPLNPTPSTLAKIGSIAVHADEMLSSDGHAYDQAALVGLLTDPEVKDWINAMTNMAMVPRKRVTG